MTIGTAHQFDIAIVGGGTVGISLALGLLRDTELCIAVIEPNKFQKTTDHPGFDSRCLALGNSSFEYLTGLLSNVSTDAKPSFSHCPITHIQVSDRGFVGKCNLSAKELNVAQMGMVVPINELGQVLYADFHAALARYPERLSLVCPATIEAATQQRDAVALTLSTQEQLAVSMLVLADGGRSPLRQQLGFTEHSEDYNQTAIIANVQMQQPHANRAFERFTENGPIALLPLEDFVGSDTQYAGCTYSLVWTVASAESELLQRLLSDDAFFVQQLQHYIGQHHGRCVKVSERASYPLALRYTEQVQQHRCVVVGNAAQTLHPIAGQGFNLGLRDVIDLVALTAKTDKDELGSWQHLHRYATLRKPDRDLLMSATDTLVRSFSNHYWPLVLGRNLGLQTMNSMAMLRNNFARRAMGYR
ncbi:FAD-dependent monooxygenase [Alteromonas sp. ASW11-36]|uniref:FAD-dependent monooxygenase n=1 Tax=Alteromonas arenosi TaxID=3055817 RepID=A0ABT7STQ1_9ALTE|nr:FAD-dependent monooxygenase [Alteromonas sp. ASW11-36]MDM7859568.1 FAD-dependent monooxygenase [Alteromonas sp. ASW11-36]